MIVEAIFCREFRSLCSHIVRAVLLVIFINLALAVVPLVRRTGRPKPPVCILETPDQWGSITRI